MTGGGEWRRETIHRMGRRLPGWDYRRPAYYVITIVCADRRAAPLGELEVKLGACAPRAEQSAPGAERSEDGWLPCPPGFRLGPPSCPRGASHLSCPRGASHLSCPRGASPEFLSCPRGASPEFLSRLRARVRRSALGEAVFAHFRRMGEFTPGLRAVYCEVMPDHLHFIVEVVAPLARPLGNAIAGFKTGCEKIHARLGGAGRLFAEGFVDQIILRAGQMAVEFDYLHENPLRLAVKRLFPGLFRHSRLIEVAFRGESCALAPAGCFSALGNHFLLSRPLVQVQVSRADFRYRRVNGKIAPDRAVEYESPAFCEKRDKLLEAGRRGAVLLSPCVSEGERQIARLALEAGLPLVAMRNKGFSDIEKPGGRMFEACAAGQLLLLAPAAWPFQPGEKPMTRLDATAMNRLCQWIAGPGAAQVNYRGLAPADIDALARAACAKPAAGAAGAEQKAPAASLRPSPLPSGRKPRVSPP